MRLRIEVTADDIAKGKRNAICLCPVALAAKRAGLRSPRAEGDYLVAEDANNNDYHAYCPPKVVEFIEAFDEKGPDAVKPFAFTVSIPKSTLCAGPRTQEVG